LQISNRKSQILAALCSLLIASVCAAGEEPPPPALSERQVWALRAMLDDLAEDIGSESVDRVLANAYASVSASDRAAWRRALAAEFDGYRYSSVRFEFDAARDAEWEQPDAALNLRAVMRYSYAPRDEAERDNAPGSAQRFRLRWDGNRFHVLDFEWFRILPPRNEKTFFPALLLWGALAILLLFFWVASTLYVAERTRNFALAAFVFLVPVLGALAVMTAYWGKALAKRMRRRAA
jgi:hypothetical protein